MIFDKVLNQNLCRWCLTSFQVIYFLSFSYTTHVRSNLLFVTHWSILETTIHPCKIRIYHDPVEILGMLAMQFWLEDPSDGDKKCWQP